MRTPLINFDKHSNPTPWKLVNDSVMGGISVGNFLLTPEGFGNFYGQISLENNGGFSSVKFILNSFSLENYTAFIIKIKGNGGTFQFRVKASETDNFSYAYQFSTNNNWQIINIPFAKMYPIYRGKTLNQPNFKGTNICAISFLIANKKIEKFSLLINNISIL